MSIVTKKGDWGKTRLASGEEVSKSDVRLELYGTLDELIAHVGVARSLVEDAQLANEIRDLELELFRLCGELACTNPNAHDWVEITSVDHLNKVEDRISVWEKDIELPKKFIVPGASQASAALDVARAVARKLERGLTAFSELGEYDNKFGLMFMNRLSDYLFLLARAVEKKQGCEFDTK